MVGGSLPLQAPSARVFLPPRGAATTTASACVFVLPAQLGVKMIEQGPAGEVRDARLQAQSKAGRGVRLIDVGMHALGPGWAPNVDA